jgi:1-phosphofructokinase family hexose kinase
VLAGSLPPGVAPSLYADLIHDIQGKGARAILDASGAALQHGCAAHPFLVKPNGIEMRSLTGMPINSTDDALAAARKLHGIAIVVISLGKDGALLAQGEQGWIATPPTIREHNPIGAGDSMVAGLVWALSRDYSPPEALRWSVACGAATASLSGTAVGRYADVQRLATEVALHEITRLTG